MAHILTSQQNTPLLCSILSGLCASLPLFPHYHTPYPTSGPFMKLPDSTKEPGCLCGGCGSSSYLNFGGLMLLKLFGGVCQIPSQPQLCSEVLYRKEKEKREGREGGRGAERQQDKVHHQLFLTLTTGSQSMGNDDETKYSN